MPAFFLSRHWFRPASLATPVLAALALAVPASAIDTSYFTHDVAEDWAEAQFNGVVVTAYGDLRLGRPIETLASGNAAAQVVYDMVRADDGTVYAATGPDGVLLRIRPDADAEVFDLPDVQLALCVSLSEDGRDGRLLVGTGGERGRVLRVTLPNDAEGEVEVDPLFTADGVKYVWQIATMANGDLLVATGPEAKLYRMRGDGGEAEAIFTAKGETNVQAIALGEDETTAYAGTSPNGLVWQIDLEGKAGRVLFDAAAPEITALARVDGQLYVTAAAEGRVQPTEGAEGRPGVGVGGVALGEGELPDLELPDPPPVEPDPIPLQEGDESEAPEAPEAPVEPEAAEDALPAGRAPATVRPFTPQQTAFADAEGSALYRIDLATDRAGLVSGVLRDGGLLYDAIEQDGVILVAAGATEETPARVIRLDPRTGETSVVATPDAMQVTVLEPAAGGVTLVGLSNPGGVAKLAPSAGGEGTVRSNPLEAGNVSQFGTAQLLGRLPEGAAVAVRFRSGNTSDPDAAPGGWGDWTQWQAAQRFVPTGVEPARFLQYELRFKADAGGETPVIERLRIAYQPPNLPPSVSSITVAGEATDQEVGEIVQAASLSGQSVGSVRTVSWEASDPNEDVLTYDVLIRRNRSGEFQPMATGSVETAYAWDARATGEGLYEVKVIASDARSNRPGEERTASRVTEPFRVDLTPPQLGDVEVRREGNRTILTLRAMDVGGQVARVEYLGVGGDPAEASDWRRAFPEDGIADSPEERYTIEVADLPAGTVRLRVRAVDDGGNLAYTSLPLPAGE